jgi:hypothetical protein
MVPCLIGMEACVGAPFEVHIHRGLRRRQAMKSILGVSLLVFVVLLLTTDSDAAAIRCETR